jgi:eukaryotic-like serine/threonine-protein kinase
MKAWLACWMVLGAAASFAQDGASFRGDAQHSGLYKAAGVPRLTGLKWKFKAQGPVISSPAVVDGVVYFGSVDHFVYALDQTTGAQRWKQKTGGRVTSSPAVVNGRVFIGSYDGQLYALDAASGEVKWKFNTEGERRFAAKHLHGAQPAAETMPDPFDFYLSSAAVVAGVVYFGSGDGNVYAVDAGTGQSKWIFHTGDVVHASPAVAHGVVYVGSWDSYFYAIDAATGKEKWRFKTGEDHDIANQVGIQSSAVIAGGTVYFGCRDSNLYAVDATTGTKKWAFSNKGSWVIASPVVHAGTVYFATSDSGLFNAVDAKSGAPMYSLSFKWPMFSSPAIAGKTLYLGSHAGKLLAIDLQSRQLAWSFETDGAKQNGPAYTKPDGAPNYAAAFTDFFYDDMVTGLSKMMSVGAVLSSPAIVNDTVYFGSTDGHLYALN